MTPCCTPLCCTAPSLHIFSTDSKPLPNPSNSPKPSWILLIWSAGSKVTRPCTAKNPPRSTNVSAVPVANSSGRLGPTIRRDVRTSACWGSSDSGQSWPSLLCRPHPARVFCPRHRIDYYEQHSASVGLGLGSIPRSHYQIRPLGI